MKIGKPSITIPLLGRDFAAICDVCDHKYQRIRDNYFISCSQLPRMTVEEHVGDLQLIHSVFGLQCI